MATRNFIQQGLAYGSTTASVTVSLDGNQIFSGSVLTLDQPVPPGPGPDINDDVCQWTLPADFSGQKSLTVQVSGSPFILADTMADRTDTSNTASYVNLYWPQTIGNVDVSDPLTNVAIDGIPQARTSVESGQWYWKIYPGQTLTATLNVSEGVSYPDWDPVENYAANTRVVYQTLCWSNGVNSAPAGTVPTENPQVWFTVPLAEWDINLAYPIYSRVSNNNKFYAAIQNVPIGTSITDTNYWQYRSEI